MATTTINGIFIAETPGNTKNAKSLWDHFTSLPGRITKNATRSAVQWTKDTAMPAIAKGADTVIRSVDHVCTTGNQAAVNFLVKYPGIAMTLSPQTIVRMAVAEHYKEMAGQSAADSHLGDAVDNVEHIAVNIMQ